MSENSVNPETTVGTGPAAGTSAAGTSAEETPAEETSAVPARGRRRVAATVGAAVLLVVVAAGTGYTVVTVNGADRAPGTPLWAQPKAAGEKKTGERAATGLKGALLPYGGDSYERGPDLGAFGSEAELSGRQAAALRKESVKDFPRSERRKLERQIDEQRIKGMAMRSYQNVDRFGDDGYTVDIVLSRMADRRTARSVVTAQRGFLEAVKAFRKGPAIEGHEDAVCFLPPDYSEEKLDLMVCSGYVGDVLVTATATAAKPLDKKGVAQMLREQFDRIEDPGQAV
ncbi:hypothetical protein AB0F77_23195 [Streptomyces sp. NPDC026672]|uniref:hypothetical protein n=1 Tax=unclassified Streptomyces TaxID=2593676 RepID=UPI0033FB3EAD